MHVQTELEGSILQCFTRSKLEKSEISTEEKTLLIPAPTFWTGFSTAIVYKITKNASSFLRKISFRVTIYLVDILILNYMIQELKWAKTQWTCPKITISRNKCRFKLSKLVVKTCQNLFRSYYTTLLELNKMTGFLSTIIQAMEPGKMQPKSLQHHQIVTPSKYWTVSRQWN